MTSDLLLSRLQRVALLGVLGFVALLPALPSFGPNHHDLSRLAQLPLMLLAVGLAGLEAIVHGGGLAVTGRSALVALMGLLSLASAFQSAVPAMALRELLVLAGLSTVAGVVCRAVRSGDGDLVWKGVTTAAALYACLFVVLTTASLVSGVGVDNVRLIVGYDNPRFLNHVQTVSVPLLAAVAVDASLARFWRGLAALSLTVDFALVFLTLGRSTLLSLVVAASLALLFFRRDGRRWLAALLMTGAGGLLLVFLLLKVLPSLLGVAAHDSLNAFANPAGDHSRFLLWDIAARHIQDSPWLGIGPMHYAHVPNPKGAHPHNLYLQIAAEFGLPVLLLLLAFIAGSMRFALREIRRQGLEASRAGGATQCRSLAAWLACAAALTDAGFSGNLVMPMSQVWIAVAAGLLAALRVPRAAGRWHLGAWLRIWASVVLLVGLAWLTVTAWMEWKQRQDPQTHGATDSGALARPRFWLDGWF